MLEVGVRGTFTPTENRAHFSMCAIMAAPLIAGNDITTMPADVRAVLTNTDVLAVNQDTLGRQAQRFHDFGETEVWAKTLLLLWTCSTAANLRWTRIRQRRRGGGVEEVTGWGRASGVRS